MCNRWWDVFFLANVAYILLLVGAQQNDPESHCTYQKTCQQCLQASRCVWCSQMPFEQTKPLTRCITRDKYLREGDAWCKKPFVIDYQSSMTIEKNIPFSNGERTVQVQPQKIKLKLRKGEEYKITFKYSQAEDYPVDLYYLMDLSSSMHKYRNQLSELGLKIAQAMMDLTSNFHLGFGSFVDKVVLPMTDIRPSRLKSPCVLKNNQKCAAPYGFKHVMSLTANISLFKSHVLSAPVSGNIDAIEGGLDALMQAMVCTEKINWRPGARHLIVFSTDAGFHVAGDGKLAGIIEPNDGLCHLDKEGLYDYSLLQDYPSVAQIHKKSREHNMNIIFAVPQYENTDVYNHYKKLSEVISGSSVGTMHGEGKNIVRLIGSEYKKLVNTVTLMDNKPSLIDIKYFSRCLDSGAKLMERRECGGVRVGNVIEFEIIVKAVDCPSNPNEWTKILKIKPQGINEEMTVHIDIICDCKCSTDINEVSTECNNNGKLKCGVCSCEKGFDGKQCECKGREFGFSAVNTTDECKANSMSTEICSGRGACLCGGCSCTKRSNPDETFTGKYCECDNFTCKRSGGQLCGGHGKCDCGKCNCYPGWGGEACDCRESNSTCTPPMRMKTSSEESVKMCNGRGDCICGTCHCHEKDNIRYSGRYCEDCPTCQGQRCEELKNCVECKAYGTGPYATNGKCDDCIHDLHVIDVVKPDTEDQNPITHFCRTPGDQGCTFVFKYEDSKSQERGDIDIITIYAQKERECPVSIDILGVMLWVVVSTIILGLLIILIWKVITTIHDKREFEKFEKERALARWERNHNPLYKEATSTFKNPTFRDKPQTSS